MHRSEMAFRRGDILSKEMLEELYRYPREATESFFAACTDGILYGLSWRGNGSGHQIQPGALKFQGRIYYLTAPLDVEERLKDCVREEEKYRLVFRPEKPSDEERDKSLRIYSLTLEAFNTAELKKRRSQVFYYMYALYMKKEGFLPLEDPNEIYGLCAAEDGYPFAFSPDLLFRRILPEIEDKANKHPMDFLLMQTAFRGERLSVRFIRQYLKEYRFQTGKGGDIPDTLLSDSAQLLNEFLEAVQNLRFAGQFEIPYVVQSPQNRKPDPYGTGRML